MKAKMKMHYNWLIFGYIRMLVCIYATGISIILPFFAIKENVGIHVLVFVLVFLIFFIVLFWPRTITAINIEGNSIEVRKYLKKQIHIVESVSVDIQGYYIIIVLNKPKITERIKLNRLKYSLNVT